LDTSQFLKAYEEFFLKKKADTKEKGRISIFIHSRSFKRYSYFTEPEKEKASPAPFQRELADVSVQPGRKTEKEMMKEQKAPVIRSGRAPSVIFNEFKLSDSLVDSVEAFNELKAACGIASELQGKKRIHKNQLFIHFSFPPPPN